MAEKPDPFDVAALEKSVNDSAMRVSTIWVTYLIFGLYLAVAAGNVTHRQLFLAEPIKLPALNIDLPLVGFFFLAPVLFVILHCYVLMQIVLLARTAAAYDEAIEHSVPDQADRSRVRQRLANTLFAQIFAGSPREREGTLGMLLRIMAWTTLAIAPVLVLLTFQVKFLPYQSELVTWTHRLLIAVDLAAVFLIWPAVLDARRDLTWRGLLRHRITLPLAVAVVVFSVAFVSFPGEPHATWTRYAASADDKDAWGWVECHLESVAAPVMPRNFDRLALAGEDVVDDDKLAKINAAARALGRKAYLSERSHNFQGRNLRCSSLVGAHLRHTDFGAADLSGANLLLAELQGATFHGTHMERAILHRARLQRTAFIGAKLRYAILAEAQLQGALVQGTQFQHANLYRAQFQGAALSKAGLQGAVLQEVNLQGALVVDAFLQGALLSNVDLRGALVIQARLQGADLMSVRLDAATIFRPQLQGTSFQDSRLALAAIHTPYLWRAGEADCTDAQVTEPQFEALVEVIEEPFKPAVQTPATPGAIEGFIAGVVKGLSDPRSTAVQEKLRKRLGVPQDRGESEKEGAREQVWRACAAKTQPAEEYDRRRLALLVELTCQAGQDQRYVAEQISEHWLGMNAGDGFVRSLARAFLGLDGRACPGAQGLDDSIKDKLRGLAEAEPAK